MNPPDYTRLLNATAITGHDPDIGVFRLDRRDLGDMVMPTGRLIANDPLAFFEVTPFDRTVQAGAYPVSIYIADFKHRNQHPDQRVAYALIRFQPAMPIKWEMAYIPLPDTPKRIGRKSECYGVDAGTGAFMDEAVAKLLTHFQTLGDDVIEQRYQTPLIESMETTYQHTRSWANFEIDPTSRLNVIAFSSGWGDGCYVSYWGLDDQDQPVALVTDFGAIKSVSTAT